MKNWMPTVAAAISAAASFVMFAQFGNFLEVPKWVMGLAMFAQAGGLAAFGIVAKQYNVTGGSVGQPSTPAALQAANQAPNVENKPQGPPPAPPKAA